MTDEKENALKQACGKMQKVFCDHPHEAGETYFQHLLFTICLGLRLVMTGLIIVIHGIFPFLFTRTSSNQIFKIFEIMKKRNPAKYGQ